MFRDMRRFRQMIPEEECLEILRNASSGVLAVLGDDGYPYTIPMNYSMIDDTIYFHCAKVGHKIDAIRRDDKVSFCVIGDEAPLSAEFATRYKSVVVFGRLKIVEDPEEMYRAVKGVADKYSGKEPEEAKEAEIRREWDLLTVLRLDKEHMTGKMSKSYLK